MALEGNEGGLVVPIVKNADKKNIYELAREIEDLAVKARAITASLEDYSDGTFTITNYGSIGSTYGTPLPNYPETGILGLGRARSMNGAMMLPLSVTYDHRIVDGAVAVGFLNRVKELLSNKEWISKLKY